MRYLLLLGLFLTSLSLAQEGVTGADGVPLSRDAADKPTFLKTKKLAEPVTGDTPQPQNEQGVLNERTEVSSSTLIINSKRGDFSCPTGTEAACLNGGDKVCPGSTRCIDEHATCFDNYPCNLSGGFVCQAQYDNAMTGCKQAVGQYDELATENVSLREQRLERKNCVLNASNLKDARSCVR